jgi:hypothetical protein
MEAFTLLIALVALVIAVIAFQRTGGLKELRQAVENLSPRTEGVRDRTANMLDRFGQVVRGKNKTDPPPNPEPDKEPGTDPRPKPE